MKQQRPLVPPLSPEHREAVRQSNLRRSDQTIAMNKARVWTPEMIAKREASRILKVRERQLRQIQELGINPYTYARWLNGRGYWMVSLLDHPVLGTCTISEHRVVLAERLGRRPTPDEIGHHRDKVKTNNSDDNIEITNASDHSRLHAVGRVVSLETRAKVSAKMTGRKFTEEHKRKIGARVQSEEEKRLRGDRVRATCAAKREAGTHHRGPDSEEVRARKKASGIVAAAKRKAEGGYKFRPKTQEERDHMSRKAQEMWDRRRAAEPGSPDSYEPIKGSDGRFIRTRT